MASMAYDNSDLFITLSPSDIQSLTIDPARVDSAYNSVITPTLNSYIQKNETRQSVTVVVSEYLKTHLLLLKQSDIGFGVRLTIPWLSVFQGNSSEIIATSIRGRIRPHPFPFPQVAIPLTPIDRRMPDAG